ncbi:ABC transporter substrate-binding protein [Acetobacter indonesiensis]|uniref:ABC transporter substrate-binding protein n=1 Tax=Acetobacter indonesiensis TaxID=104101 RepID=UPI0038D230F8
MKNISLAGAEMRRFFSKLVLLGAVAFAAVTLPAHAGTPVRVGYIPVLGSSALFVVDGEGWAKEAGLDLQLVRFTSGPQAIQALVSGRIDAYVAGVLPLLQARAHGSDVKVVTAASVEELEVVTRGALAAELPKGQEGGFSADAVKGFFTDYKKTQSHLPRIAAQPAGSVPDSLLRYWLQKKVGLAAVADSVSIVGVDIDAAQQAFLAGAVDAAVLREPALTVVRARVPEARTLATGHDLLPDQPGSVLAIVKPEAPEHQAWAKPLAGLFVRATTLLANHPDEAAPFVTKALGGGILNEDVMKKALERSASRFVSDPTRIVEGVKQLQDFEVEQGLLRKAQPVDDLFDLDLWRQLKQ